jgi:hypothetical protein
MLNANSARFKSILEVWLRTSLTYSHVFMKYGFYKKRNANFARLKSSPLLDAYKYLLSKKEFHQFVTIREPRKHDEVEVCFWRRRYPFVPETQRWAIRVPCLLSPPPPTCHAFCGLSFIEARWILVLVGVRTPFFVGFLSLFRACVIIRKTWRWRVSKYE